MPKHATTLLLLLTVGLGAICAGGCGGAEFTRVNYETIYLGQPADAVESKLGEPTERQSGEWIYVNDEPWYRAVIRFRDGQVVDKQWWWTRP